MIPTGHIDSGHLLAPNPWRTWRAQQPLSPGGVWCYDPGPGQDGTYFLPIYQFLQLLKQKPIDQTICLGPIRSQLHVLPVAGTRGEVKPLILLVSARQSAGGEVPTEAKYASAVERRDIAGAAQGTYRSGGADAGPQTLLLLVLPGRYASRSVG